MKQYVDKSLIFIFLSGDKINTFKINTMQHLCASLVTITEPSIIFMALFEAGSMETTHWQRWSSRKNRTESKKIFGTIESNNVPYRVKHYSKQDPKLFVRVIGLLVCLGSYYHNNHDSCFCNRDINQSDLGPLFVCTRSIRTTVGLI